MTTSHDVTPEEVMAFVDGELDAARAAEVGAHMQSCAACQQIGRQLDGVANELDAWAIAPAPSTLVAPASPVRPWLGPIAKLGLVAAASAVLMFAASQRTWWQDDRGGGHAEFHGVGAAPAYLRTSQATELATKALPFGAKLSAEETDRFAAAWLKQPRTDPGFQTGGVRVLIQMFIDWLCRTCYSYNNAYADVIARYDRESPGAVQYVVKDWPWNNACNPQISIPGHEGSCVAALAVRIARDRGQAQAMIAWLFDNYERLRQMSVVEVTEAIKQETRRLTGIADFDVAAAAVRPAMERDIADGVRLQIKSTPTVFINGVRVPDDSPLPPPYFDAAISIELKRSAGKN